jgi:hypothetical protein
MRKLHWYTGILASLLLACSSGASDSGTATEDTHSMDSTEQPAEDTAQDTSVEPDTQTAGPDTQAPSNFSPAPASCQPTPDLGPVPLQMMGTQVQGAKHLLEATHDPETGRVFLTGIPGLIIYDVSSSKPQVVGFMGQNQQGGGKNKGGGKFEHLEILNSSTVVCSSRGRSKKTSTEIKGQGLYFLDTSDPENISMITQLSIDDAGGMALNGSYLYVLAHNGKLYTVDVTSPKTPTILGSIDGLKNPWELVVVDDYAYVADNTLGIVTLDISDPASPNPGATTKTTAGAQDIVHYNNYLFAAVGTSGVQIYSLSDPASPVSLGVTDLGGSVISVSVANDRLWAATQERIVTADVTDPSEISPLGFLETPSWAMHVEAVGDTAYLSDWNALSVYQYDPSLAAPQADISRSKLYWLDGTLSQEFTITNRGSKALTVTGISSDDSRFEVLTDQLTVSPGDHSTVLVQFASDGQDVDTSLCIATNDPYQSVHTIPMSSSSDGTSILIGEPAMDFNLIDTSGNYHVLSEQLGKPVVLIFFATW